MTFVWGEVTLIMGRNDFWLGRSDWGRNDHGAKWPDTPVFRFVLLSRSFYCVIISSIVFLANLRSCPERYRLAPFSICMLTSVSKRVFVQNLSSKNDFDLHETEHVGGTYFHMNGFRRRLVSTQRQKATPKQVVYCWNVQEKLVYLLMMPLSSRPLRHDATQLYFYC